HETFSSNYTYFKTSSSSTEQENQVYINLVPKINEDLLDNRIPLFIENLYQIGDSTRELCKHYYQLGERLAMHNWDEEVKGEMKD
ncbi:4496_t:CDS:2, partial [Racocetra persica]